MKKNKMFNLLAAIICSLSLNADTSTGYICTNDPAWVSYINGESDDDSAVTVYSTQDACNVACSTPSPCNAVTNHIVHELYTYTHIDENTARAIKNNTDENLTKGFGLKIDGANYWYLEKDTSSELTFPELDTQNRNIWLNRDGEESDINGINGDKVKIIFRIWAGGTPTVEGQSSNDVQINFPISKAWELDYESSSGTRKSGLRATEYSSSYTIFTQEPVQYYYCPLSDVIVHDADAPDGTGFTDNSQCEVQCVERGNCIPKPSGACRIIGDEVGSPVTDYTGKTVYTKKTYTIRCTTTRTEVTGCNRYRVETNEGNLSYNDAEAGWETKDFSASFGDAMAASGLLEQMQHIWSGWYGYCESGWKFDTSWLSDPMTWLSYAMMAYNAGNQLSQRNPANLDSIQRGYLRVYNKFKDIGTKINNGINRIKNIFSSDMSSAEQMKAIKDVSDADLEVGKAVVKDDAINTLDKMQELNHIADLHTVSSFFAEGTYVDYTDIAQVAMSAFAPMEESDISDAINFKNTILGSDTQDEKSLTYRDCMASIGLTAPNMIAWAIDSNQTSEELLHPWENPLRVTKEQVIAIQYATSPEYVDAAYRIKQDPDDVHMYTLIALTSNAYTQAGQAICAGAQAARASNVLDQQSSDGGVNGSALANASIKMVLSKLPPPYNLVASFVFQVITSFTHGNACHNTKIAMQWGMLQYKTNKFSNFEMCHATGSQCAAKWFWGKCMRTRYKFCCYDQILTRVFAEGLKEQLYAPDDPKMWASCSDLTINDLKNLSFRQCNADETPYENHCFPKDKYDEFKNALLRAATKHGFDVEALKQQAINSMAIPH